MTYQDITKTCKERECGKPFVLTAGEQKFFETHTLIELADGRTDVVDLTDEMKAEGKQPMFMPARCPECRAKKRRQKNSPFRPLLGKELNRGEESGNIGIGLEGKE